MGDARHKALNSQSVHAAHKESFIGTAHVEHCDRTVDVLHRHHQPLQLVAGNVRVSQQRRHMLVDCDYHSEREGPQARDARRSEKDKNLDAALPTMTWSNGAFVAARERAASPPR